VAEALIVVGVSPGERRVVLIGAAGPHLVAIDRPDRPDGIGDLHRARVLARSRAMSGAFLALAGGATAFLPDSEMPDRSAVSEGAILPIRLTRAAQGDKGPRASARLTAAESAVAAGTGVALIRRGPPAAARFAALAPGAPVHVDDPAEAARLKAILGERVRLVRHAFDDALECLFEELASPVVALNGGGRLTIHPTPALTAIDVDAGAHAGGDPDAVMRLNRQAVAQAARQIRLRELAGAILLDVAGLRPKQREALSAPLAQALAEDPLRPRLLGLTRLGLFEIQRQRIQPPLHERLGGADSAISAGLVALRRALREAAAAPGREVALRAAPVVIAELESALGALAEFALGAGRPLRLVADTSLPIGGERIEG
jgi:Ribonuclease G/E